MVKKLFILAVILILVNIFYGDKIEQWWQGWRSGEKLEQYSDQVADKVADKIVDEVTGKDKQEKTREINEDNIKENYTDEEIKAVAANLPKDIQLQIDNWLLERDLNEYGDPQDTVYTGGTPTFDEQTGESVNRFEVILDKFPELFDKFKISIEELTNNAEAN